MIVCVACFLSVPGVAQSVVKSESSLNLGAGGGFVTGAMDNYHSIAFYGYIQFQYGVADNVALVFECGYDNLMPKTVKTPYFGDIVSSGGYSITIINLGPKWQIKRNFYFSLVGGVGFEQKSAPTDLDLLEEFNQTKVVISPSFGYQTKNWQIGLRYSSFLFQRNSSGYISYYGANYGISGINFCYKISSSLRK
jgi:hypothetical protein